MMLAAANQGSGAVNNRGSRRSTWVVVFPGFFPPGIKPFDTNLVVLLHAHICVSAERIASSAVL
jgi:hypothetical protein